MLRRTPLSEYRCVRVWVCLQASQERLFLFGAPQLIPTLYLATSSVVWNGNPVSGASDLALLLNTMPGSKHELHGFDCHPLGGGTIEGAAEPCVFLSVFASAAPIARPLSHAHMSIQWSVAHSYPLAALCEANIKGCMPSQRLGPAHLLVLVAEMRPLVIGGQDQTCRKRETLTCFLAATLHIRVLGGKDQSCLKSSIGADKVNRLH